MQQSGAAIAIFADHLSADEALTQLVSVGFSKDTVSVVGKGFHPGEEVSGFYSFGDRIKFWSRRGAFWGELWGLFLSIPVAGQVFIVGYLAAAAFSVAEVTGATGGMSVLGAALHEIGLPQDSVAQYETAVAADSFLVIAHGGSENIVHAKSILDASHPFRLDTHTSITMLSPSEKFTP